jgi:hypothetical protein
MRHEGAYKGRFERKALQENSFFMKNRATRMKPQSAQRKEMGISRKVAKRAKKGKNDTFVKSHDLPQRRGDTEKCS